MNTHANTIFLGALLLFCGCGDSAGHEADNGHDRIVHECEAEGGDYNISPREAVCRWLKDRGLLTGYNAATGAVVSIAEVEFPMDGKLLESSAFYPTREAMIAQGYQKACAKIGKMIKSVDSVNRSSTADSSVEFELHTVSQTPLTGAVILTQSESYVSGNPAKYRIAVAVGWSPKHQEYAREIVSGNHRRSEPGVKSLHDWLEEQDLSSMSGVRSFVDDRGNSLVLGISCREIGGDAGLNRLSRQQAKNAAREFLALGLNQEVMNQESSQSLSEGNRRVEKFSCHTRSVAKQNLPGTTIVFEKVCSNPLTGRPMVVIVCACSAAAVAASCELDKMVYAKTGNVKEPRIFEGRATFVWRKGDDFFNESRTRAFKIAYVDLMAEIGAYLDESLESAHDFCLEMREDDQKETNEMAGRKARPQNYEFRPSIQDQFANSGWRWVISAHGGGVPRQAIEEFTRESSCRSQCKVPMEMKISQQEFADESTGTYTICLKAKIGKIWRGETLKEGVEKRNLATLLGPRQFEDAAGVRWLLGVGINEEEAFSALCLAAGGEISVESREAFKLAETEDDAIGVAVDCHFSATVCVEPTIETCLTKAQKRKFVCETVHPATNEKVPIIIYAIESRKLGI